MEVHNARQNIQVNPQRSLIPKTQHPNFDPGQKNNNILDGRKFAFKPRQI